MKGRSRFGLNLIAIGLVVAVLVRNCNAATISSPIADQADIPASPTNSSNASHLEDDYYSAEDDYDYSQDISPTTLNLNRTHTQESLSTSSSTTTTIQTTTANKAMATSSTSSSFIDSNFLGIEDGPPPPPLQPCPLDCSCEQGFVNCSNMEFSLLPQDLPRNVISLDLSGNLLKEIDLNALTQFADLRELNLSNNAIDRIQKLSSPGSSLSRLLSIDLTDNKLAGVLDPDTFQGLTGLRKLWLANNSIGSPEKSLLNLPSLEELYLRNCTLESLPVDMFTSLSGLKILDMSDNPFKTDFDINTFEPLTAIKKLRIGLMEEDQVLELCTLLTTIDVINFPDFKISCFEYVNGYTFEQSMVSNTPQPEVEEELQPPPEGDESALDRSREINDGKDEEEKPHEDPIVDGTNDKHQLESEDIGPKVLSSAKPETDEQVFEDESNMEREKSAVHQDLMNQILLGIIVLAFIGLVIGVVCRKDYCGVKTKCCRTRRPSQTDQVTPAPEEVPLNKITTVPTNGNGNGSAPLNGNERE